MGITEALQEIGLKHDTYKNVESLGVFLAG